MIVFMNDFRRSQNESRNNKIIVIVHIINKCVWFRSELESYIKVIVLDGLVVTLMAKIVGESLSTIHFV